MASSYSRAQQPLRGRGGKKCPHHFGNDVIYICEKCDDLVCVECVTKVHKGHDLEAISDDVSNNKQNLKDFMDKAEQDEIPCIMEKLQSVDDEISKTRHYYQRKITDAKGQNHTFKQKIDNVTDKMFKFYKEMEQERIDSLLQDSKELRAHLDELKSRLQLCRDTLQPGGDVLAYDISRDNTLTFSTIPISKSMDGLPEFTPWDVTLQKLELLLRELLVNDTTTAEVGNTASPKIGLYFCEEISRFKPYEERFSQGGTVVSMYAVDGNKVWMNCTSWLQGSPILLTDHHGNIQKTIQRSLIDFCPSPRDDNILYHRSVNYISVYKIRQGESSHQFTTRKFPTCMCVTEDDHIVLGYQNQLAKYTPTGQVICKTETGLLKSPIVREPRRIKECPVTRNLAVLDEDGRDYGSKYCHYVAIMDKDLKHLYNYFGDRNSSHLRCSLNDLCYTQTGELFVTHGYGHHHIIKSVVLVSGKGEYMKTLYEDTRAEPQAVCVQSDNTILVSFDDLSVRVLKQK